MSQLSLEGVYKAYYSNSRMTEARVVLEDIDINIEEGEFVSIIGPSGCGKTTILNLLAGFEKPTKGSVSYNGKEIAGPSPERGVVFQEYSLFPWIVADAVYGTPVNMRSLRSPVCGSHA